jgi:hypothetical protein
MLKTVSSITNAIGALNYKGTWNASTNTPTLASGAGTKGDYYVVGVAGTTSLDGISNWGVGDWATFNGSVWQRVEGGADLNGVNVTFTGTASGPTYETSNAAAGLTIANNDITADGTDANIDIDITPKGTGEANIDAVARLFGLKARTYQTGPTTYGPGGNQATGSGFLSIPIQVGDVIDFVFGQTRTVTAVTDTVITVNANFTISWAGTDATGYSSLPVTTNAGLMLNLTAGGECRAGIDDTYDWGSASFRWDDIYATNNVIQTSDENQKQDIRELLDAEKRVAVALKGLMRAYRWKSAVSEKGDGARIHFGAIAQRVRDAFISEGLDPGRYGVFIESKYWENQDGHTLDSNIGVDGKVDESLIEKSKLGIRYNELFAFIIAGL